MGRLAELLGRTGADLGIAFSALNDHPLRMQVLYQFTRRPLTSPRSRADSDGT